MSDFKEVARPVAMVLLVVGLIGLAVGEALGYSAIEWFRIFAISLIGEWFVERGVTKAKGG